MLKQHIGIKVPGVLTCSKKDWCPVCQDILRSLASANKTWMKGILGVRRSDA